MNENEINAIKADPHVWTHDGDLAETYGLEPNFGCCTANFNQGWPKFSHLLVFSTPNRTAMSFGVMILGAEWVLRLLPRGTHEWDRFLTPDELTRALAAAGLTVTDVDGIALDPARGFDLSDDMRVNYIGAAVVAG